MKKRNHYNAKQRITAASMLIVLSATATIGPGMAFGGFVDDWVTQKSSTGASSYQGAQRGYYSGGSFSSRVATSNDNLVSISTPTLKIGGCGGIDMFLGGMSFLNVDFLVQKLQKILAQAPAAAFDIALKTLAPQVAETIKTLESIADKLNGLQIDDCKAGKALVATVADFSPVKNDALKGEIASAQASFMQSSGANDLWNGIGKDFGALQKTWSGTKPTGSNAISDSAKASLAGCPAEVLSVFGADGSMLSTLANQNGIPAEYIPILRGFIGDVALASPDTTGSVYDAVYIPPCGKNDGIMPFIDGKGQKRDKAETTEACTDLTDTNKNLTQYVADKMIAVAAKMKGRAALDAAEKAFLQSMPLPISITLKNAVAAKTEAQVVGKLADITSKAYAYYMLTNMLGKSVELHNLAKHIVSAQKDSKAGSSPETCNMQVIEPAMSKMELLEANTIKVIATAQHHYSASLNESQAIETFVQNMARFRDLVQQEISQQFGQPVARRVTGG